MRQYFQRRERWTEVKEEKGQSSVLLHLLVLVLDRSVLKINGDVSDSTVDQVDLVGDGAAFVGCSSGLGLAIGVGSGGNRGSRSGASSFLSLEALDFLAGLGNVLGAVLVKSSYYYC